MGNAEGDIFYAEAFADFAGFAMEFHGGAAAALADDFDIDPADAAAPTGAERFHRGFFCGEAAGVPLVFIFEALAVFAFGGGVKAAEDGFAVALDGGFYAADFGDVDSEADDQEFLRGATGTLACARLWQSYRAAQCDLSG